MHVKASRLAGSEYNEERAQLKRRLMKSLRNDREQWWAAKVKQMEKAAAIGNSRQLFRLIKETGGKRSTTVSETIAEKDGSVIHSQGRRLERWVEHFEEQFNWPPATSALPAIQSHPESDIEIGLQTLEEVEKAVGNLKRGRAAGPDGLTPDVYKDGGGVLLVRLTEVLTSIWESNTIPSNWSKSRIIPVFKKGEKSSCDNHRGISLTNIVSKILGSKIIRCLSGARELQAEKIRQVGFRPANGCVDQIFKLRQVLEHRHAYRHPTIAVFLDLKVAYQLR
ncbi:unnamed protein product [Heterobilharzia americana]|nr:unnamed protein product [Heterobilharzia americana]